MNVTFDFDEAIALVTGTSNALGSTIAHAFHEAGVSVVATDVVEPDDEDDSFETEGMWLYGGDFIDENDVARVIDEVVSGFGRLDHLANIAGTWRGGTPIGEIGAGTFDFLLDVNLKTVSLVSKHAIPHLQGTEGSVVNVSARSSPEGGEGDGIYHTSKAGARLLIETTAEENHGGVCAGTVMPSVIGTPMNRKMMADADFDSWMKPAEIARAVLTPCPDMTPVTSGAAIPVYGGA